MLVPLHRHRLLRFLVVPRFRCHAVTANRSRLNTPPTSTKIPSPHALSQPPRLYSYFLSIHRALSQLSLLTFPCDRILDAPFLASFLAARLLVHHISLWALARPVVLPHLLRMHRGASATNVNRRVARRLPHSHAAALLTPPPRFTHFTASSRSRHP